MQRLALLEVSSFVTVISMVVSEEWLFGQFDVGKVLFVQLDEVIVSIGSTKLSPLKIV